MRRDRGEYIYINRGRYYVDDFLGILLILGFFMIWSFIKRHIFWGVCRLLEEKREGDRERHFFLLKLKRKERRLVERSS